MQRVRIEVDRLRRYASDTTFDVFGDLGTGVIDLVHPLTPRRFPLWPEAEPRRGHLVDGHLVVRHLDGVSPDGHLDGAHLRGEHLLPAAAVTFDTPWYVFGRFGHSIVMYDGAGNASSATTVVVVINSDPRPPGCVRRSGYDAATDVLTFSFSPSRFEPVPGK